MSLKSGDYVVLRQKRERFAIWARSVPGRRLAGPLSIILDSIPYDTDVLYVGTKAEEHNRFGTVYFHLVLWNDRLVWVSSEDAVVEKLDVST